MKYLIFLLPIVFIACSKTTKSEHCTVNGRAVSCSTLKKNKKILEVSRQLSEKPRLNVDAETLKVDCAKVANEANLSEDQSNRICASANAHSQTCLENAVVAGLLREDIAKICENAREGSVACIQNSRIEQGKYSEEVAQDCK